MFRGYINIITPANSITPDPCTKEECHISKRFIYAFSKKRQSIVDTSFSIAESQKQSIILLRLNSSYNPFWVTCTEYEIIYHCQSKLQYTQKNNIKVQLALNLRLRKLSIFLTQCWSSRVKTLRVLYLMLLWFTHTLKSRSERKPNTRLL